MRKRRDAMASTTLSFVGKAHRSSNALEAQRCMFSFVANSDRFVTNIINKELSKPLNATYAPRKCSRHLFLTKSLQLTHVMMAIERYLSATKPISSHTTSFHNAPLFFEAATLSTRQ
jgi:hypothetical protein